MIMMLQKLINGYHRWKSIRETIAALDGLPTEELNDLGIARWRIPDLAERSYRDLSDSSAEGAFQGR